MNERRGCWTDSPYDYFFHYVVDGLSLCKYLEYELVDCFDESEVDDAQKCPKCKAALEAQP